MLIGGGLVAKAFKAYEKDENVIVFASGVSNSTSEDVSLFEREKHMLLNIITKYPNSKLIYFSTCSIYDNYSRGNAYVEHKLKMEEFIRTQQANYNIFRISNLAGFSTNPHTVLNYFFHHINKGIFFYIWKNASRNIIDIDDAYILCDYIVKNNLFKNKIVNIANPENSKVMEIVANIELLLGKKGNYEVIEKSSDPVIDVEEIKPLFKKLQLTFDANYLSRVISKYYSSNKV
ncbi:MAG: NAD-dependent epimerase/dehydratase family protein [Chitinophagaceae bacterium]|nr:NAD-dependent epimerase/dehydratase family protein [Chitinophagaceae bacterium]